MKTPSNQQSAGEAWAPVFGSVVVGSILLLILATALAGWPWVESFLTSSAPAWIQAVGSVAAIVAALAVVQRQHSLELERREADDHTTQLRRARTLRVIFLSAARVCEDAARAVGSPHQTWKFRAEELREARSRLLAIDPLLVPDGGLLLIIEDCAMRLRSCALIVGELETPRRKQTEEGIKLAVMATARECWLGHYEATGLEARLCKAKNGAEQPYSFDDFAESRKELDEIRANFLRESSVAPSSTKRPSSSNDA